MINIYVYDNEDMEGEPFHVFYDVEFDKRYKLKDLKENTTYYISLKNENGDEIEPSEKSQRSFTTLE